MSDNLSNNYLYEIKDCFLTQNEINYIVAIHKCLPDGYYIQPQVNLASIINRTDNAKFQNELFRNVDACIFDIKYHPIAIIEINDSSHNDYKRKERDAKVRKICEEAGLPVITLWTSYGINTDYITKRIVNAIEQSKNPNRIKHSKSQDTDSTAKTNENNYSAQSIDVVELPKNIKSNKSKKTALILSACLGFIGMPFYYLEKNAVGILLSVFFFMLCFIQIPTITLITGLPEFSIYIIKYFTIIYMILTNVIFTVVLSLSNRKY